MTYLHYLPWLVALCALALSTGVLLKLRKVRRTESVIRAREAQYRSILQDQTEMVCRWQVGGIRIWVNDAYCDYFQQSREALIGTSFFSLIAESDKRDIQAQLAMLTEESPSRTGEHQVLKPDGTLGWQEWTDRAIFDDAGSLVEFQSVGRDISARKSAELALVANENRYRSLVEETVDWVWEMNLDFHYTYSNNNLEHILGYSREELAALPLEQLLHPEDMAVFSARLPLLIAQKKGWKNWHLRFKNKYDGYRILDSCARPLLDSTGTTIGYQGIDRDVTFTALLNKITAKMLAITLTDALIEETLAEWAEYFSVDTLEVWWFDESHETSNLSHIWHSPRREKMPQLPLSIVLSELPWLASHVKAGDVISISDPSQFPPEAEAERALCEKYDLTASVVVPMNATDTHAHVGSGLASMVGETRQWSDRDIQELRLAFNAIATAEVRLRNQRALRQSAEFQDLHSEISASLLQANLDEVDNKIHESLASIAEQFALDRASIWCFEENRQSVHCIHRWAVDDQYAPLTDLMVLDEIPWLSSMVLAGKIIKLNSIDDIPMDQTADRAFFETQGALSELIIPLFVVDQHVGVGVFNTLQQIRSWSPHETNELRLVAETIMNTFSRTQASRDIAQRERDLSRSEALAHVGSYSFYPESGPSDLPGAGKLVCSEELLALMDCKADEVSTDLFVARLHPDDRERVVDIATGLLESGSTLTQAAVEYRIVRPNGEIIHIEDRSEVTRHPHSGQVELFSSLKDVTERVHREKELKESLEEISRLKEQLQEANVYLREEIELIHDHHQIIGESPQMKRVLTDVERVAETDASVLILGETGTGKELIARAIHQLGSRSDTPMISVNCAALSESLIESELFGHERGAFTGADKLRKGRFELANNGTLFLDEIGELPLALQAKLLRVLQMGSFERLGGTQTLQVDVRLIAATNRDLQQSVDQGSFRADLFYRINSFPIHLPPIRDRGDDIQLLTEHFIHKYSTVAGREITSITPNMLRHIRERSWPGNARELESFIEYTLISGSGPVLDYAEQPAPFTSSTASTAAAEPIASLDAAERNHIQRVLAKTGWKIAGKDGAAELLGVPSSTLRSRMKRLGITQSVER